MAQIEGRVNEYRVNISLVVRGEGISANDAVQISANHLEGNALPGFICEITNIRVDQQRYVGNTDAVFDEPTPF